MSKVIGIPSSSKLHAAPKPKMKFSFGDRVRMHREGEGWSMRDAAKNVGTSPATLSRVENGKTPDVFTLAKLCRWMGFSAERALHDLEAQRESHWRRRGRAK